MEKLLRDGYIKMLAVDIDHLESYLIEEKNTTCTDAVEAFQLKYQDRVNVILLVINMPPMTVVNFSDYQKIISDIHPGDYIRDLVTDKQGKLVNRKYILDSTKQQTVKYIDIDRFSE